jgi:hypothetical protein
VEVLEELMGRQLSFEQFTLYDFSECYHHVSCVTEWFYDGYRRVINDFHVPSMFKDNFRVTLSKSGTFFRLQTRISPTLLNAADRVEQEFDPRNRDTSTIISSICQTVNVIANDLGTDFDNQWSEGNEYALPFPCNPLLHVGIVWQYGNQKLLEYRAARASSYARETLHQQIPLLRVIFMSQDMQRMSAMKADKVVILQSPTRNLRGAGLSAPLPPAPSISPFGGGSRSDQGYGGGGFGGGHGGGRSSFGGGGGGGGGFGGGGGGGSGGFGGGGGGGGGGGVATMAAAAGGHDHQQGYGYSRGRGRRGATSRAGLNESSMGVATSTDDNKRRKARVVVHDNIGVEDAEDSDEEFMVEDSNQAPLTIEKWWRLGLQ